MVKPLQANLDVTGKPTPPEVSAAMKTLADYLKVGGWVQAIINAGGGAAFRLTSIYDDLEDYHHAVAATPAWLEVEEGLSRLYQVCAARETKLRPHAPEDENTIQALEALMRAYNEWLE